MVDARVRSGRSADGDNYTKPINLGTDELSTINALVDAVCEAAGKSLRRNHDLTKPQRVRGRNRDNTVLNDLLGWQPGIALRQGIKTTYDWIAAEIERRKTGNGSHVS